MKRTIFLLSVVLLSACSLHSYTIAYNAGITEEQARSTYENLTKLGFTEEMIEKSIQTAVHNGREGCMYQVTYIRGAFKGESFGSPGTIASCGETFSIRNKEFVCDCEKLKQNGPITGKI